MRFYNFNKETQVFSVNSFSDLTQKPGTANAEDLRTAVDQTILGETVKTPVTNLCHIPC